MPGLPGLAELVPPADGDTVLEPLMTTPAAEVDAQPDIGTVPSAGAASDIVTIDEPFNGRLLVLDDELAAEAKARLESLSVDQKATLERIGTTLLDRLSATQAETLQHPELNEPGDREQTSTDGGDELDGDTGDDNDASDELAALPEPLRLYRVWEHGWLKRDGFKYPAGALIELTASEAEKLGKYVVALPGDFEPTAEE